jgi:hypothetical protein
LVKDATKKLFFLTELKKNCETLEPRYTYTKQLTKLLFCIFLFSAFWKANGMTWIIASISGIYFPSDFFMNLISVYCCCPQINVLEFWNILKWFITILLCWILKCSQMIYYDIVVLNSGMFSNDLLGHCWDEFWSSWYSVFLRFCDK